jgi:4-hydroxyphenylpyruvate dioxygenase-like putative hemolysin
MKETQKLFTPLGVDHIVFACYDRHFWQRVFERFGFVAVENEITEEACIVAMMHGDVRIVLVDPEIRTAESKNIETFIRTHGDMQVMSASILVDDVFAAGREFEERGLLKEDGDLVFLQDDPFGISEGFLVGITVPLPHLSTVTWNLIQRFDRNFMSPFDSWKSRGVDHFAIGVDNLEDWQNFYLSLGFDTIYAPPHDKIKGEYSGMKTVAMQRGGWVVALVEGVDSNDLLSQVSTYVKAHGDHAIQHAAIGFSDLYATFEELKKRRVQFRLRRAKQEDTDLEPNDVIHVGEDHSGPLFQCFTKPWARRVDREDPSMSQSGFFFEAIQRVSEARKAEALAKQAFDDRTVIGLFNSIEREQVENDRALVFPSACMREYRFQEWLEAQR